MKQKTVHLDSESYDMRDGIVHVLKKIDTGGYETWPELEWTPSKYKIGAEVMLYSTEDVSPNSLRAGGSKETFSLMFDAPDGIGGNMDHSITHYHGWRGTTSGIETYAYGLRKITQIRQLKNGTVSVTVGKDLHPEET